MGTTWEHTHTHIYIYIDLTASQQPNARYLRSTIIEDDFPPSLTNLAREDPLNSDRCNTHSHMDSQLSTCGVNLPMTSKMGVKIYILHSAFTQAPALHRCQPRWPIFYCSLACLLFLLPSFPFRGLCSLSFRFISTTSIPWYTLVVLTLSFFCNHTCYRQNWFFLRVLTILHPVHNCILFDFLSFAQVPVPSSSDGRAKMAASLLPASASCFFSLALSPSFFLRFLSCSPTFRVPPLKLFNIAMENPL